MNLTKRLDGDAVEGIMTIKGKGKFFKTKQNKKKQLEKCPDANVSPRNMTDVLGRA